MLSLSEGRMDEVRTIQDIHIENFVQPIDKSTFVASTLTGCEFASVKHRIPYLVLILLVLVFLLSSLPGLKVYSVGLNFFTPSVLPFQHLGS